MRNSQLAMLSALGFVLAVLLALTLWIRLQAEALPELSGERVSRSYDVTGFDGIEVGGQWQVTVERGDAWQVAVDVPAELIDDVGVELRGDRVGLQYRGGWWSGGARDELVLRATITMPAFESLDVSGATKLSFSGFEGASLSIDVSGAAEIRGAASRFDALTLDVSGAVSIDLQDVPVTDADVDVSGAGNVTLRMAGGRLTGDLSGAANVQYFGTVSEERIRRSGFANVRRRN